MLDRDAFGSALHDALSHLYDPTMLRRSPLIQELGFDGHSQPLRALRNKLTASINELHPDADVPRSSGAERLYRILNDRFLEQFTQQQVALDMALSIRQLRRLEKQAIDVLADILWRQRAPVQASASSELPTATSPAAGELDTAPGHAEELERLRGAQLGPVALSDLIEGILTTLAPFIESAGVIVERDLPADLPLAYAEAITLRQALVNVISFGARITSGRSLHISAHVQDGQRIALDISGVWGQVQAAKAMDDEARHLTQSLLNISHATLMLQQAGESGEAFHARLTIPAQREVTVLGIDDNRDILQMMERYLAASRYRFCGCSDPQQALALAERYEPDVIVMDIMLPRIDGWELVGRLREHPGTHQTPILVCSILPQEELASMLGAAGFIRKPVSRKALLQALDRHCSG